MVDVCGDYLSRVMIRPHVTIKGGADRDIFALNNTTIKSIETIDLGDAKEQGNQLIITGGTIESIGHITGGIIDGVSFTGDNESEWLAAGFEWMVAA